MSAVGHDLRPPVRIVLAYTRYQDAARAAGACWLWSLNLPAHRDAQQQRLDLRGRERPKLGQRRVLVELLGALDHLAGLREDLAVVRPRSPAAPY